MGYCKKCDKLVFIRPGEFKFGSRERYYYPLSHDKPDGGPCDGDKRAIT